jgi:cell division protein FtsB
MRKRRFDMIVTIVSVALLSYFAWHAFKGPRGYPYRDRLESQLAQLQAQFGRIDAEHSRVEHKVSLMRPDSIDPDMLDELARADLEMTGPNDIVAFTSRQNLQPNP